MIRYLQWSNPTPGDILLGVDIDLKCLRLVDVVVVVVVVESSVNNALVGDLIDDTGVLGRVWWLLVIVASVSAIFIEWELACKSLVFAKCWDASWAWRGTYGSKARAIGLNSTGVFRSLDSDVDRLWRVLSNDFTSLWIVLNSCFMSFSLSLMRWSNMGGIRGTGRGIDSRIDGLPMWESSSSESEILLWRRRGAVGGSKFGTSR